MINYIATATFGLEACVKREVKMCIRDSYNTGKKQKIKTGY